MMLGQIGKLDDSELELLFNEVLNPIDCNFAFQFALLPLVQSLKYHNNDLKVYLRHQENE